jgi:hypothetical protein
MQISIFNFIFLVFCAVLLYVFKFELPCCGVRYDFRIKTMLSSSLHPAVCRRADILFTLVLFVCVGGVQWVLCCVFVLFFFVLCTLHVCCQFLWIVHLWLPLRHSLMFILVMMSRLVEQCYFVASLLYNLNRGRRGRDRMVVGFITSYAISDFHHWCCEFESRSGRGVQQYVITFVSDFGSSGFLHQ